MDRTATFTSEDRKRFIRILSPLGWSAASIAEALGCTEARIREDLREIGGARNLSPERSQAREDIYTATFRHWLNLSAIEDVVLQKILEVYLELPDIFVFLHGMESGYQALQVHAYPHRFDSYVAFAQRVLRLPELRLCSFNPTTSKIWETYLLKMRAGDLLAPTCREDVQTQLLDLFRLFSFRGDLLDQPSGTRLVEVITSCFHGLAPRDCEIVGSFFGLAPHRRQTVEEIAASYKVSVEEVRNTVRFVIQGFKGDPAACLELSECFQERSWLQGQKEELRLEVLRLREELTVLSRQQEVSTNPGGSSDDLASIDPAIWSRSVADLGLSTRPLNGLQNRHILRIGELVQWSEAALLKTQNFGRNSLEEIKAALGRLGLKMEMILPAELATRFYVQEDHRPRRLL